MDCELEGVMTTNRFRCRMSCETYACAMLMLYAARMHDRTDSELRRSGQSKQHVDGERICCSRQVEIAEGEEMVLGEEGGDSD